MNLNVSAIYMIVNIVNDKVYIGSASNFRYRRKHHRHYLNTNQHHNKYLQHSWNKYGEDAFIWTILEIIKDKSKLDEIEQKWLDIYNCFAPNNGYNIRTKAENNLGVRHSEEAKKKISESNKGKHPISEEHRKAVSKARTGLKHTEEAKAKMSASRIGKKLLSNRDFEKWPHELGNRCKCDECRKKQNAYEKEYRKKNNKKYYLKAYQNMKLKASVAKLVETHQT